MNDPNATQLLDVPGFEALIRKELLRHGASMDAAPQGLWGGGAVAEAVLFLLGATDVYWAKDFDVFGPEGCFGRHLDIRRSSLFYLGPEAASRRIPFLASGTRGSFNLIELGVHLVLSDDLLASFDLNVCQATWHPSDGDQVRVTQALLDAAGDLPTNVIRANPLVEVTERTKARARDKAGKLGSSIEPALRLEAQQVTIHPAEATRREG